MATIWDVAAMAGVSKSTASLVINNSPLVGADTRERVLQAIKELNYVPNNNARNLQKRHNNSIGIIHVLRRSRKAGRYDFDFGLEHFSRDIEEEIFYAVSDTDANISVGLEHFSIKENPNKLPVLLRDRKVDGVILLGGFDKKIELDFISKVDIPAVLITSFLQECTIDTVMHAPSIGAKMGFEELIRTGHKKICFVNIPEQYRVWPQRIEGVRAAADEYGYELDPDLIISVEHNTPLSAYMAMNKLLDKGLRPDAILTADNDLAAGAMRCFYERGMRVPDDISFICYEDTLFSCSTPPGLTAVDIQKDLMGRNAVTFLLERMKYPDLPPRSCIVEPRLVRRQSVKNRLAAESLQSSGEIMV